MKPGRNESFSVTSDDSGMKKGVLDGWFWAESHRGVSTLGCCPALDCGNVTDSGKVAARNNIRPIDSPGDVKLERHRMESSRSRRKSWNRIQRDGERKGRTASRGGGREGRKRERMRQLAEAESAGGMVINLRTTAGRIRCVIPPRTPVFLRHLTYWLPPVPSIRRRILWS